MVAHTQERVLVESQELMEPITLETAVAVLELEVLEPFLAEMVGLAL
jgi:hypothetical protein